MGRRLCGEDEYPALLLPVAGYRLPGAYRAFPGEPLAEQAWASVLAGARSMLSRSQVYRQREQQREILTP